MTEIQFGKKRRFSESESSIDGVDNDPESTIIQLQAQLRNQDIEIEDLKKQMTDMKKKAELERRTLLAKNEKLEQRLQKVKDLLTTDPFFRK